MNSEQRSETGGASETAPGESSSSYSTDEEVCDLEEQDEDEEEEESDVEKPHVTVAKMSAAAYFANATQYYWEGSMAEDQYFTGPEIGTGGFSTVIMAKHRVHLFMAALKYIQHPSFSRESARKKASADREREVMEILSQLKKASLTAANASTYTSVIDYYGFYAERGRSVLAMEYCSGGDLFENILSKCKERVGGRSYFVEEEAARVFPDMISALDVLFEASIVHRDIKPANFVANHLNTSLTSGPHRHQFKLIDFGLCCCLKNGNGKDATCRVGTLEYYSPELLAGQAVTCATDMWGLGVVLYNMLTGLAPFPDGKEGSRRMQNADFIRDVQPWLDLSEQAQDLIGRMLTKDPKQRITLKDIRLHPWVKPSLVPHKDTQFSPEYEERIRALDNAKKFRVATLSMMAFTKLMRPVIKQRRATALAKEIAEAASLAAAEEAEATAGSNAAACSASESAPAEPDEMSEEATGTAPSAVAHKLQNLELRDYAATAGQNTAGGGAAPAASDTSAGSGIGFGTPVHAPLLSKAGSSAASGTPPVGRARTPPRPSPLNLVTTEDLKKQRPVNASNSTPSMEDIVALYHVFFAERLKLDSEALPPSTSLSPSESARESLKSPPNRIEKAQSDRRLEGKKGSVPLRRGDSDPPNQIPMEVPLRGWMISHRRFFSALQSIPSLHRFATSSFYQQFDHCMSLEVDGRNVVLSLASMCPTGVKCSKRWIEFCFRIFDADDNNIIDMDEFLERIGYFAVPEDEVDSDDDSDSDSDCEIDSSNELVRNAMAADKLVRCFQEVDTDNNGTISMEEFTKWIWKMHRYKYREETSRAPDAPDAASSTAF